MPQSDQEQHHAVTPDAPTRTELLVEEARAGNRTAFARLANIFHEDVFRMVYYRTRSKMDAEDLTQEIFIKAFNNVSKLKEVNRFKSWLFSIAVNRVRDFHRKNRFQQLFGPLAHGDKQDPSDPDNDVMPDALDLVMRRDFWKKVGMLLDKLPKMEREVFILRFMDHLSIKEVS